MKLVFLSFFISFFIFGQEEKIAATIELDNFGNLHINSSLPNLNIARDTIVITGQLLLHRDQAELIGGVKFGRVNYVQYLPKTNSFSYVVNLPKGKTDSYVKTKNFFITTIDYLANSKKSNRKLNSYDIKVTIPENYSLVYPKKKDLEESHRTSPTIIAGDFYSKKIKGFNVYNLNKFKKSQEKVDEIINVVEDVYAFYLQNYPDRAFKPKIVFIPFISKTLLGRTSNEIMFLNSKMLS